jgi:probable rRNA maturation factor
VLAFPKFNFQYQKILEFKYSSDNIFLGNIILGYQIIEREAKMLSISFINHFIHLYIHAILHLLGFDHENYQDAIIMEALEQKIIKKFSNTYIKHD